MSHNFEQTLSLYDFEFPKELIAQRLVMPRDAARLLIYDRKKGKTVFDQFKNLIRYLPANAVLVFNETKVMSAKLEVQKETGGKASLIYIQMSGNVLQVMADRQLHVGSKLYIKKKAVFAVAKQSGKFYFLKPLFSKKQLPSFLEKYGHAPLPPYIKDSPLSQKQLKKEYQTIFAKKHGSIAAPTAALHFTKSLFQKLTRAGITTEFVTLHVNLGTFATLTQDNLEKEKLHMETYEISQLTLARLNRYKKEGRPIIAVGTTTVRTLESAVDGKGILRKKKGTTDIFIREGYAFKFVSSLITNFHVPRSSLLMLVAALVGREKLLSLYNQAIVHKFKLFSFGDGMFIL